MPLRIFVHDYAGHPFQAQLSRHLARRGHDVLHGYSQSVQGPQGAIVKRKTDQSRVQFTGIRLSEVVNKQALVQRFFRERQYGRLLAEELSKFHPDVVISSSSPIESQVSIMRATRKVGARFVFWLQDVHGLAIEELIGPRFHGFGHFIARHFVNVEKRLLRESDAIVSITEDFKPTLRAWNVPMEMVHVIPNWASMEELPERPKDNEWSRAQGLVERFCFLYSGTMGLKHDPAILLELAKAYGGRADVEVVVISEGAKADWLKAQKALLRLENLRLLPFQPYADVPDVMGTADVLVAVLDANASAFSVPSKVLSYHCAGRPILLSVPGSNLAARIVTQSKSGTVVEPWDMEAFLAKAEELRRSPELRHAMGQNALNYARQSFNIDRITDQFEALFASLMERPVQEEDLADEPA